MKRLWLFFIFLALFTGAYQLGSMSEVSDEDAKKFIEEFEALILDIDAVAIFIHNFMIALPMFIPGFGIGWGLFSAWSTGYAFASIATQTPVVADIPPLSILYLSPFGLMELVAYSLGISRSYILLSLIIKRISLSSVLRPTIIEVGVMTALLLAGGFIEFYIMNLVQENGFTIPGT